MANWCSAWLTKEDGIWGTAVHLYIGTILLLILCTEEVQEKSKMKHNSWHTTTATISVKQKLQIEKLLLKLLPFFLGGGGGPRWHIREQGNINTLQPWIHLSDTERCKNSTERCMWEFHRSLKIAWFLQQFRGISAKETHITLCAKGQNTYTGDAERHNEEDENVKCVAEGCMSLELWNVLAGGHRILEKHPKLFLCKSYGWTFAFFIVLQL